MIIFDDSVREFYQCSVRNSHRQSADVEAFADASVYLGFLIPASAKKIKNAEAIEFLGILKKYVSKNKIYFCLKKKSNVLLNNQVVFVFHTIFKLDFITQIIYCIIHRCLYSLFMLFLFSYTSFLETEYRNNVNPSLFIQLAKV